MAPYIKLIHLVALFTWIGSLFAITRLLIYQAKEEESVQKRLSRMIKRMYRIACMPSMIIVISTAIALLFLKDINFKAGWLHIKLTCAVLLIFCDWKVGRWAVKSQKETIRPFSVRALHLSIAFLLIGTLFSIYVYRDKEGEMRQKILSESRQSLDWQKSHKNI